MKPIMTNIDPDGYTDHNGLFPTKEQITKKFMYQGRVTIPKQTDAGKKGDFTSQCDFCRKRTDVLHIWTDGIRDIKVHSRGVSMMEKGMGICPVCQNELMNMEQKDD